MTGLSGAGVPTLWLMEADAGTTAAIRALIEQAYKAMSTPGDDVAGVFGHEDMTVAGSGQGELLYGPEQVIGVARMIASRDLTWVPEQVKVWSRDDVAWAQILGYVEVSEDGAVAQVPYWTTGVFVAKPIGGSGCTGAERSRKRTPGSDLPERCRTVCTPLIAAERAGWTYFRQATSP
jgi:hypothetical protein